MRGPTVRFVYQYPDLHGTAGDFFAAGPVTDVARAAETAGWLGLAFTEHPAPSARWLASGGHQTLDPFVALANAAAVTTELRLLTYLTVAPYRNPALLAKTAATVDAVSGGRFVLGIGAGYLKSEFAALGVDFDERNALVDEALDVLPLHWSGEPFSYTGLHFEARDVISRPRPVQQPIPIWVGGNAPRTLRRVAERAQGWMPLLGPPELTTTTRTAHIGSTEALAQRVAELRELAGSRTLDIVVPYLDPTTTNPTDDVERHRAAFVELAAAGVTWIVVVGTTHEWAATRDFLEGFGSTYIR